MRKQNISIKNFLRGIIFSFAVLIIYTSVQKFAYIREKEWNGYYFSIRFEHVISNLMETAENYHEKNVLIYDKIAGKNRLNPDYRMQVQEDLDERAAEYEAEFEKELENLKQRQLDSALPQNRQEEIKLGIEELEERLQNLQEYVEDEEVAKIEKDLDDIAEEFNNIKNATILFVNKEMDHEAFESEKSTLERQKKFLADQNENYYWLEVGAGSCEIESSQYGLLRRVAIQNDSVITDNIKEPEIVSYSASRLTDKDGLRMLIYIDGAPESLKEHDIIQNGYRQYLEDLSRIHDRAALQMAAGILAILLLLANYILSKQQEKKKKLEGISSQVNKTEEIVNSFTDKLIYFVRSLKLEGKIILFLLALSSFGNLSYFEMNMSTLIDVLFIGLGAIAFADFVQTDKEEYFVNSIWHDWRNSRRKKRFKGLAKGLEFLFDAVFVIGAAIIASFVYSAFERNVQPAACASLFGGTLILILIWRLYGKLLDERMGYIEEISTGLDKMVSGESSTDIVVREGNPYAGLAENINRLKAGYGTAMEEKVKSERMKTELITNVSHDLKTPLTSIINYIDLLKKEEIKPEFVRDYIHVLEQKAERLNTLIQDLFEASKAASGDLALEMEQLDVAQLLQQTLAEMDGKIEESNLQFVTHIPSEPIMVFADGKKLHRVFDNLIINCLKYSLEGTRVYIDLIQNGNVKIIMKNIANYEMNFVQEEIVQRFTRGDWARASEGSGLGLAIAQSLVDLMDMRMEITTDGDLFKIEIEMDKI